MYKIRLVQTITDIKRPGDGRYRCVKMHLVCGGLKHWAGGTKWVDAEVLENNVSSTSSDNSWGERDNLTEVLLSEFSGNNTTHSSADRLVLLIDQHAGVVVESDNGSIVSLDRVLGSDNNSTTNVSSFHTVRGGSTCDL